MNSIATTTPHANPTTRINTNTPTSMKIQSRLSASTISTTIASAISTAAVFVAAATVIATAQPAHAEAWVSGLTGLIVGPGSYPLENGVLKPFVSDGCSMSPDGVWVIGSGEEWVQCCIRHDVAYWIGGTKTERETADTALAQCMADNNYPKTGVFYKRGVAFGGDADSTNTYRWGYGWNYKRPYQPITPLEMEQAETLYGKDLQVLHERVENRQIPIADIIDHRDPSLNKLTKDEKKIYAYLQTALNAKDVIVSFSEIYFNLAEKRFGMRLESCPGDIQLKVLFKDGSIRVASDPAHCLKPE